MKQKQELINQADVVGCFGCCCTCLMLLFIPFLWTITEACIKTYRFIVEHADVVAYFLPASLFIIATSVLVVRDRKKVRQDNELSAEKARQEEQRRIDHEIARKYWLETTDYENSMYNHLPDGEKPQ